MAAPNPSLLQAEAHMQAGRFPQAEALARRVIQRDPSNPIAAYILGSALKRQGKHEQAHHFLERAAKGAPAIADHWSALAEVAIELNRYDQAQAAVDRTLALNPTHIFALLYRSDLHLLLGRPEQAEPAARDTVAADPGNFYHRVTHASFTCYSSRLNPQERLAIHRDAAAAAEAVPRPPVLPLDTDAPGFRDPERPLRIAYLSADFLTHSVSYFFEPILQHADRARYLSHCYFASIKRDATTDRLQSMAAGWRDLPTPGEAQIARDLRVDEIDIAVDLGGFSGGSIIWPLRQRLVPVQVTYLGYPHSTALTHIDYRVVDSLTDPAPEADALATEKLIRLDPCFLCYRIPASAPPVAPPPSAASPTTPVTFGSFNLLGKLSEATRATWKEILDAVPGSRLLLKDGAFAAEPGKAAFRATLAASGIDPARVELMGKTKSRDEHLALYAKVDIALDPFPYHGTTTTCEALLMGVPVITLAGDAHVSRVGVSLLSAVGLPELIAPTRAAYIRLAKDLAADRPRLAALRAGMRARLAASPLCDGPAFTRRWEAALRSMWRTWCETPLPS